VRCVHGTGVLAFRYSLLQCRFYPTLYLFGRHTNIITPFVACPRLLCRAYIIAHYHTRPFLAHGPELVPSSVYSLEYLRRWMLQCLVLLGLSLVYTFSCHSLCSVVQSLCGTIATFGTKTWRALELPDRMALHERTFVLGILPAYASPAMSQFCAVRLSGTSWRRWGL